MDDKNSKYVAAYVSSSENCNEITISGMTTKHYIY